MKYLKTYEKYDYEGKKIWKVPFQDPYLKHYFKKIGFPYYDITPESVAPNLKKEEWIYIMYDPNRNQPWLYSFIRKRGFETQKVSLSDLDKETIKYNL